MVVHININCDSNDVEEVMGLKNKTISGIFLAILGGLISIAPFFLISQHCLDMGMKCFWAAKTELGIGALIILLALFFILFDSREIKMGISLSLTLVGILSALIPTALVGLCNGRCSVGCMCNSASSLIMAALSLLVILISFITFIQLKNRS